jgi:short-subunit dehydrogenase
MRVKKYFQGKKAWITGASSGIGEAIVRELAEIGVSMIISSNDEEGLLRVAGACNKKTSKLIIAPFDLASTDNIDSFAQEKISELGGIDFLFNIGGISQRARVDETPLWLDRKIFEINYFGTIALTKAILPHMIRQRSGHIAATSSISGRFGFPLRSAYSASKQALHGFFETLYLENKNNNIRTSVIIPGRVRTNISLHALDAAGKEHGKMDPGLDRGIPPQKAADIILKGMASNKREILVGGKELMMLHIRRIWPWLFFRIGDKVKST